MNARKPTAPAWLERKTAYVVVLSAALAAIGSEAAKNWIPSILSYGWNWATDTKITYVTVTYGEPARPIVSATVAATIPGDVRALQTISTDENGSAKLVGVPSDFYLVLVSFPFDGNLIRGQQSLKVEGKFNSATFSKSDAKTVWTTSQISIGATSIIAAPAPSVAPTARGDDPRWLKVAMKEIGVNETGQVNKNKIADYHASTTLGRQSEEVAWGCSFVSWVLTQAEVVGNIRSARCADWLRFGATIPDPRRGALVVFRPFVNEAASGFVGFVLDADDTTVTTIAGNIEDSVKVAKFSRSWVRGYRWPE